ncbi:MAG: hypothetical protein H6581_20625 [Bacteroidia bacterium]|nr:hypothetical protein [Bacteroidia bacterium]
MICTGPHTRVEIQSHEITRQGQQIGLSIDIPYGVERAIGIMAIADAPPLVIAAQKMTKWSETVAGKLWFKWNAPVPFFHFQKVDLLDQFDQHSTPFGISPVSPLAAPDFRFNGKRLEPHPVDIPSSRGYCQGWYRDELLASTGLDESYLLYLYIYYQNQ